MYGFYGKLLRVDLTEKTVKEENISDDVLQKYLGGKGLGTHLLLKYLPAKVDPISPDNKLVFVTGPAAGTIIPAAGRFGVFAKSPQTNLLGQSYSGGHVAPAIKGTGYDAIMLEGASMDPVYLHISDEGVEFGDAADLWGQETYATEDALLEKVNVKGAQAVVIGPAGENLISFACIENNYWRSAGRTGLGTVMGSKKVKGVVFSGSKKAPLADEAMLKSYVKDMVKKYKDSDRSKRLREYGTPYMVNVTNKDSAFPTRYWSEGSFDKVEGINSDAMVNNMEVKPRACSRCFIACGKLNKITSGRHKGLELEGPEYETLYALGGLICVDKIEEVVYLNDVCDRLGIDTITAGNISAFAIEAGKRGKLEGMPDYGDVDGIVELLHKIVKKEGPGEILSKGTKKASEELGLEDIAVHIKGLEPAGYDPRSLPGMSLGYAVSDRGGCHLRSSFYMYELSGEVSKDQVEGKAKLFIDSENRNTFEDCLIICRFYMQFIGWEGMQTIVKATTGLDLTKEDMSALASRVTTLTRQFNIREGLTKKDDTLPPRMFNDPIGPEKNRVVNKENLDIMIKDYYSLHGWDEEGIPQSE